MNQNKSKNVGFFLNIYSTYKYKISTQLLIIQNDNIPRELTHSCNDNAWLVGGVLNTKHIVQYKPVQYNPVCI